MSPKRYPRTVKDLVDFDYIDRLPPTAQAWLVQFTEEYYGASFPAHGEGVHPPTDEVRRETYRIKNHRNADVWGRHVRLGPMLSEPQDHDRDWSSPPAYLDTPEYREALEAFRQNLSDDGRCLPVLDEAFVRAERALSSLTATHTEGRRVKLVANDKSNKRLERLKDTALVVNNIGVAIARMEIKGSEAPVVMQMLQWIHDFHERVSVKVKALETDAVETEDEEATGE